MGFTVGAHEAGCHARSRDGGLGFRQWEHARRFDRRGSAPPAALPRREVWAPAERLPYRACTNTLTRLREPSGERRLDADDGWGRLRRD
jgi:hypothetical protein